ATTIVPFLDPRGKPYQYMAIRYEITEQKRQEEQLREQAALTRLGEMAAVVAHEVKNPIAGIRGALQVIMSRMPAEQRDRGVIVDIIARLDALNGIVQDLLLYARPRAPKREAVDLRSLIENTSELLRKDPAIAATMFNISGRPEPVLGDPEQLRIVFQNLLMNAAQAMGGSGAIDVSLRLDPQGCRISIRDHGPGMPPEVRAKAFDAFFTTKHRGTGLGLPIARRVVEAHGGVIDIAPADGGGRWCRSRFRRRKRPSPYQVRTWHVPGTYLARTWYLPGTYLVPTWHVPGTYLARTWYLPGTYLAPRRHRLCSPVDIMRERVESPSHY